LNTDGRFKKLLLDEDMIKSNRSFTITNEQFLNKNYQANFEVNFDKPKILNFFEKKNIFPSMYKKKEFLTLLILIDNDEDNALLFDRNPFYTKWNDDTKNFSFKSL